MVLPTIKQLLKTHKKQLPQSLSSHLDIEVLLCQVLQVSRTYLYSHDSQMLTAQQLTVLNRFIQRRAAGEPIAYITGYKEFWSLKFAVTPKVLIPRPETELLVEQVLCLPFTKSVVHLADLGTGSGAVALAIAKQKPRWRIVATDYCHDALKVASDNAKRLNLNHIEFIFSHWCCDLPHRQFDVIVSNPPYIAPSDWHLQQDIRFEPKMALISAHNGLADITTIAIQAKHYLVSGGYLLLEHGFYHKTLVRKLLLSLGYDIICHYYDLAKWPRAVLARIF